MSRTYTFVLAILCLLLATNAVGEHPRFSLWWYVYTLIGGYAMQPFISPARDMVRQWWGKREKWSEDKYTLIPEK